MKWLQRGYTLIELMMVMTIMGVVGAIAYYAISSTSDRQAVTNAQLEFITNLRSIINSANNGTAGLNNRYIWIDTLSAEDRYDIRANDASLIQTIYLPVGVRMSVVDGQAYAAICAANPNMGPYTNTIGSSYCPPCTNTEGYRYFICESTAPDTTGQTYYFGNNGQTTVTVRFTSKKNPTTVYKDVLIEGNGMIISRVTAL